jgi:hypothetical protein
VSASAHFIHTCDVERFVSVGRDGLKAEKKDWRAQEAEMPCRFVEKQQRVADSALAERPTITTYTLLFGAARDVRAKDRIVNIRVRRAGGEAETIDAGPYTIDSVLTRRARHARHRSAILTKGTTR